MAALLLSVSRLAGYEVYDRAGNKLGVIDDLMLDASAAKVRYAVLKEHSMLGRSKRFAVPLAALRLDTENECFVVDIEREALDGAEGFDASDPPDAPDALFARDPPRQKDRGALSS